MEIKSSFPIAYGPPKANSITGKSGETNAASGNMNPPPSPVLLAPARQEGTGSVEDIIDVYEPLQGDGFSPGKKNNLKKEPSPERQSVSNRNGAIDAQHELEVQTLYPQEPGGAGFQSYKKLAALPSQSMSSRGKGFIIDIWA